MHKINLSNEIYNKCIKENAKEILQSISKEYPNDGTFEVKSSKPLLPEIASIILKAGFDMYLVVSDNAGVANFALVYCKKENEQGVIRKITYPGYPPMENTEYEKKIRSFLETEECGNLLNEILEEISK